MGASGEATGAAFQRAAFQCSVTPPHVCVAAPPRSAHVHMLETVPTMTSSGTPRALLPRPRPQTDAGNVSGVGISVKLCQTGRCAPIKVRSALPVMRRQLRSRRPWVGCSRKCASAQVFIPQLTDGRAFGYEPHTPTAHERRGRICHVMHVHVRYAYVMRYVMPCHANAALP